jgi:hypothetical protein
MAKSRIRKLRLSGKFLNDIQKADDAFSREHSLHVAIDHHGQLIDPVSVKLVLMASDTLWPANMPSTI